MLTMLKGRPLIPGKTEGEALVTQSGFNAYANFYNCLSGGVNSAICADSGNSELFGKRVDGKILCIPKTTGSTSAGAVWSRIASLGIAPKAVLFSQPIDSLAAGGLIITGLWTDAPIITIDQLGKDLFNTIKSGSWLSIEHNGTVIVADRKLIK